MRKRKVSGETSDTFEDSRKDAHLYVRIRLVNSMDESSVGDRSVKLTFHPSPFPYLLSLRLPSIRELASLIKRCTISRSHRQS